MLVRILAHRSPFQPALSAEPHTFVLSKPLTARPTIFKANVSAVVALHPLDVMCIDLHAHFCQLVVPASCIRGSKQNCWSCKIDLFLLAPRLAAFSRLDLTKKAAQCPRQLYRSSTTLSQRAAESMIPHPAESDVDPFAVERFSGVYLWYQVHAMLLQAPFHGHDVAILQVDLCYRR